MFRWGSGSDKKDPEDLGEHWVGKRRDRIDRNADPKVISLPLREIADCKNYSISKVAKEILDVADSLTRAQQHSENVHGAANQEMVASINKAVVKMEEIFKSYGIESFDPIGEHYDPNKQEALANTPTP